MNFGIHSAMTKLCLNSNLITHSLFRKGSR